MRTKIFFLAILLFGSTAHAANVLREDTATQIALGPFIDGTDGITPETSLTVTEWDCDIIKHANSGMATTSLTITASGGSNDAAHLASGLYSLELTATDTETAGRFVITCDHATPATFLQVTQDYMVVPTQKYDSLYGTDVLEVDVTLFGGTAGTFASGIPDVNTEQWNNVDLDTTNPLPNAADGAAGGLPVSAAGSLNLDTVAASVAAIEVDTGTTLDTLLDNLTAALGVSLQTGNNGAFPAMGIVASGTAQDYTPGTPSVTLASSTAVGDNDLQGTTILVLGSNEGDWQAASIESNVGSTDVATIDAAFSTAPTGTISYIIFGTAAGSGSGLDAAGVRAAVGLASANLDTQLSTIEGQTDDIGAAGAGLTEAGGTGDHLTAVPWNANWDVEVESEVDDALGGGTGTALTAIPWNANWDTEVQSEATDALNAYDPPTTAEVATEIADALATDTYAEPGAGTPASTTTLAAKINYLYKAWRNLSTQTADTYTLYNDDGSTAAQEAPVSDNGTTFSKGEMVAP